MNYYFSTILLIFLCFILYYTRNIIIFIISICVIIYYFKRKIAKYKEAEINIPDCIVFESKSDNGKVSVLTYNILCQKYMKRSNRKDLNLEYRMNIITQEIKSLNPDIFCIQETNWQNYKKYFLNNFHDYNFKYCENYGSTFLNLIGYRKSKFKIEEVKSLDLSKIYLEGNRGVVNVILKDTKTSNFICVYNVHFPWKPCYDFEKCLIMKLIAEDVLSHNYSNLKVLIIGDFNSIPNSLFLRLMYLQEFIKEIVENNKMSEEEKYNFIVSQPNNFQIYYNKIRRGLVENNNYLHNFNNPNIKENTIFENIIKSLTENSKKLNLTDFFTAFIKLKETLNIKSAYDNYNLISEFKNILITENLIKKINNKIDKINSNVNLFSTCNHYIKNHPKFTNYTEYFKDTIDYIFHSENLKLCKLLILPDKEALSHERFLPSSRFPSDHIKLFAEFYY